jgi:hypothetical protein
MPRGRLSNHVGCLLRPYSGDSIRSSCGQLRKHLRLPVNTYDEAPIYRVGDKMDVLCTLSGSMECKKNALGDKWGDFFVDLSLSIFFLLVPLIYFWRMRRGRIARNS